MQDDMNHTNRETADRGPNSSHAGGPVVAAMFDDWNAASDAVDELYEQGFSDNEIGIARLDGDNGAMNRSGTVEDKDQARNIADGVATGAAVGGVTGLLAALASFLIPGVGPIVSGGVLATTFGTAAGTAIAGAGIGAGVGAAAGGLVGALTSLGLPEEEARYYEENLRSGGTLVTVSAGRRAMEAQQILEQNGGRTHSQSQDSMTSARSEMTGSSGPMEGEKRSSGPADQRINKCESGDG